MKRAALEEARARGKHGRASRSPLLFLASRQKWRLVAVSVAIAVAIWLAGAVGWLDALRGPLQDTATKLRVATGSDRPAVLLVPEMRPAASSPQELLAAARNLRRLGAAGLALSSWVDEWPPETAVELRSVFPQAVIGLRPRIDVVHPDRLHGSPSASTLSGPLAWSAPSVIAGDRHGRTQKRRLVVDGIELPTLASAVAEPDAASSRTFGIVYLGGPGSLPAVSMERAASGDLVADLIDSRWALLDPLPAAHGQQTPTTGPTQLMSLLETQGHALDTLVHGRRQERLPAFVELPLLILITIAMSLVASRLGVGWLLWLAALAAAAGLAGSTLLQILSGWLAPGVEVALAGLLVSGYAARHRLIESQEAARSLLRDSMGRLQSRIWPSSFYLSDNPWPHLADLVDQTFELRRLIFLEIVPGDHRLREIHAVGCSLLDINERRRDYLRTPYSTAIRRNAPLRLERAYLREAAEDEVQYLVPLTFGDEVLGFWAFGASEEAAQSRDFDMLLRNFGDQLAEVLHHRARTRRGLGGVGSPSRSLWEKQDETFRALHWLSILLERRLQRTESLLQGLGTAVAVYDLFGRAIDVTHRMTELLADRDVNVSELTSLQLVGRLSGQEPHETRALLRRVLFGGESVDLTAVRGDDELSLSVTLSPIRAHSHRRNDEADAFNVIGIAVELHDTTAQEALSRVQSNLSERLGVRLRNDIAAVDFALQLLDDRQTAERYSTEMLAVASLKATEMHKVLEECEDYLSIDLDRLRETHYPIDAEPHLHRALEQQRRQARPRRIEIACEAPPATSHVLASPIVFERGLNVVLEFLLDDARDGTTITLHVEQDESRALFRFENQGYGTPQRTLDAILADAANLEKPSHRALARFAQSVAAWGGSLSGSSRVGEGTVLTLALERLHYL